MSIPFSLPHIFVYWLHTSVRTRLELLTLWNGKLKWKKEPICGTIFLLPFSLVKISVEKGKLISPVDWNSQDMTEISFQPRKANRNCQKYFVLTGSRKSTRTKKKTRGGIENRRSATCLQNISFLRLKRRSKSRHLWSRVKPFLISLEQGAIFWHPQLNSPFFVARFRPSFLAFEIGSSSDSFSRGAKSFSAIRLDARNASTDQYIRIR